MRLGSCRAGVAEPQPRPLCESGGTGTGLPARRPHHQPRHWPCQFSPANFSAPLPMANPLGYCTQRSSILSTVRRWDRISHLQSNNDGLRRMAPASTVIKEVTGKQSALNVKEERNAPQHQCRVRQPICAFQWLAIVVFVCWTRAVTSPCNYVD